MRGVFYSASLKREVGLNGLVRYLMMDKAIKIELTLMICKISESELT